MSHKNKVSVSEFNVCRDVQEETFSTFMGIDTSITKSHLCDGRDVVFRQRHISFVKHPSGDIQSANPPNRQMTAITITTIHKQVVETAVCVFGTVVAFCRVSQKVNRKNQSTLNRKPETRMKLINAQKTVIRVTLCTAAIALLTTSVSAQQVTSVSHQSKSADSNQVWIESFDDAMEQSKATGRPVLLVFSGSDWCGWCIKMKNNVFATAKFNEWAAGNVIMVEVDFPRRSQLAAHIQKQNNNLKSTYGQHVTSYPTVLLLNSEGVAVAKTGYDGLGADSFINTASSLLPAKTQDELASTK